MQTLSFNTRKRIFVNTLKVTTWVLTIALVFLVKATLDHWSTISTISLGDILVAFLLDFCLMGFIFGMVVVITAWVLRLKLK